MLAKTLEVCFCRCHRRAGSVSGDGQVLIVLPPLRAVEDMGDALKAAAVPCDDPIEAVSACSECTHFHHAEVVPS